MYSIDMKRAAHYVHDMFQKEAIMTTIDTEARGRDGRFTPGHSGNPKGKPPGTRNRATVLRELLLEGQDRALVQAAVEKALAGDKVGLRQFIGLLFAKPRGREIFLDLPEVREGSLGDSFGAVLRGLCSGEITTDEAFGIARLLEREAQALAAEPGRERYGIPAADEPSPSRDLRSSSPIARERSHEDSEQDVTRESPDLNSASISHAPASAPARPAEIAALLDSVSKAAAGDGKPLSRNMRRALLNSACKSAALADSTPTERAEVRAEIKRMLRAGALDAADTVMPTPIAA
jgi:hypothetical protein